MPALSKWCLAKLQGFAKKVIIILIIGTTFMQGIYNYIPETNHVSRVYSDATVLYLQFVLHVMLFPTLNALYYYYYYYYYYY